MGTGFRSRVSPLLPSILLLIALSTVFYLGNERDTFYRADHHDHLSSNGLALAANLSPDDNFLMFDYKYLDQDGSPKFEAYGRFPIGAFLAIKAAILPFGDHLSRQIYSARALMLLFFTAAALLSYISIVRLVSDRWIALAATLLAFSSYYCLYYSDMVFNDIPSLFGVVLVCHGMIVFLQENRFRQLLLKTGIALLLGWQVYGLILAFASLGLATEFVTGWRAAHSNSRNSLSIRLARIRTGVLAMGTSRYFALGVFALFFGLLVLTANFANEYFALDGETPVTDLPSVNSMQRRVGQVEGIKERYADQVKLLPFLRGEFKRIGEMMLPYSIVNFIEGIGGSSAEAGLRINLLLGAVGLGAFLVCLIGLCFIPHSKMLVASVILAGFAWSVPMRNFAAFHEFQILFHIGLSLTLFTLGMLCIRRIVDERLIVGAAGIAVLVFVVCAFQEGQSTSSSTSYEERRATLADFDVIRSLTDGGSVFVDVRGNDAPVKLAGADNAISYFLSDSFIQYNDNRGQSDGFIQHNWEQYTASDYDFLLTGERIDTPALLTPENSRVFLYRVSEIVQP